MCSLPTVSSLPSDLESQIHFINMVFRSPAELICYCVHGACSTSSRNSHSYYLYAKDMFSLRSNDLWYCCVARTSGAIDWTMYPADSFMACPSSMMVDLFLQLIIDFLRALALVLLKNK